MFVAHSANRFIAASKPLFVPIFYSRLNLGGFLIAGTIAGCFRVQLDGGKLPILPSYHTVLGNIDKLWYNELVRVEKNSVIKSVSSHMLVIYISQSLTLFQSLGQGIHHVTFYTLQQYTTVENGRRLPYLVLRLITI